MPSITLSESSQQLYQTKLSKLSRLTPDLTTPAPVISTIQKISTNLNTQKTYYQALTREYPHISEYKSELEKIYTSLLTEKKLIKQECSHLINNSHQ